MKRMGFWASDKCPRCLQPNETTMHVVQCTNISAMQLMITLQQKLQQKLMAVPTKPQTAELIDQLLLAISWKIDPQAPNDIQAANLMNKQLKLPLEEFAKGRLVHEWHHQQEQYLHHIQSHQTASRWTPSLITELWGIFFQMWLHRNKAYHSNQQTQNTINEIQQIDQEIRRQWTLGTQGLNNADKIHRQDKTLAQLLRKTRHYKQTWLQRVKQAQQSKHESAESSTDTSVSAS